MSTVTQLHDGNPDGVQLGGASTDAAGFWGVTPVSLGTTIATATTSATITNVTNQLNLLLAELQRKGIIA